MAVRGPKIRFTPDEQRKKRNARREIKRQRDREAARAFILAHKLAHPCACGYADPRALTFDHRDRAAKSFEISHGLDRGFPIARLAAEIVKCDVRCANCHTIRTQEERHWDRVW
jgi:hypothetical protein